MSHVPFAPKNIYRKILFSGKVHDTYILWYRSFKSSSLRHIIIYILYVVFDGVFSTSVVRVSISQDNVTILSESADDVGTQFDLVAKQRKSGLGSC